MDQRQKAELLRELHQPGRPVLMVNAWDVASAILMRRAGAPAVATTSAGVAWSLGRPDGNQLSREDAVSAVARIAGAVDVPVSADIESGFGADAAAVGETVTAVIAAGAVGINLEDSLTEGDAPLRTVEDAAARVAAARAAADTAGIPLYINARTDTYESSVGDPATRLDDTLARASAYLAAGASGIFVPGITAPDVVRALVEGIDAPVNILVGPGAPTVAELAALGVGRLSYGSKGVLSAYTAAVRAAEEVLTKGTYGGLADAIPYAEMNAAMRA
jgi:2-methylisocitrate lyase-like PEP mutase family enzyme